MADDQATAWFTAVGQQLGLEGDAEPRTSLDELARTVTHDVDAALAAQTTFLVGLAAGRAAEASVAADDYAGKIAALARGWRSDALRAEPANDQSRRA